METTLELNTKAETRKKTYTPTHMKRDYSKGILKLRVVLPSLPRIYSLEYKVLIKRILLRISLKGNIAKNTHRQNS